MRDVFGIEPDAWQRHVLDLYSKPGKRYISMQACVGPGKSCVLAWIGWNFLLCRGLEGEHPNGVCVSVSKENLRDGLWKELAKWQSRSPVLEREFLFQSDRIMHVRHPKTWWLAARTWPKTANPDEQGATLSGLHSQAILYLIDEGGIIPTTVLRAARQGMSNTTDGAILVAGNPISHHGILYACSVTERDRWDVVEITGDPDDPERSPRIDIETARADIRQNGRDDPWVMATILGQFSPGSIDSLLSLAQVEAAMKRSYSIEDYDWAPKILGVDVARKGLDATVIYPRQGLVAFEPIVLRGMEGDQLAGHVAKKWSEWDADACFIDDTGGYGASCIDHLRGLGFKPIGVPFSGRATDPRYFNKRSEMAFLLAEWVKDSGQLPEDPKLRGDLTVPTYGFKKDTLALEEKEKIKVRLKRSPDNADALGLTFAHPVALKRDPDAPIFRRKPKQAAIRRDEFYDV